MNEKVVEMVKINKKFGEVVALKDVDFTVYRNEIVALVGDNGAGKSTLIKILSGAFPPDSGKIFFEGKEVFFKHPSDAIKLGIRTVHQKMEEILALNQTVVSNLFMGEEKTKKIFFFKFLDKKSMLRESERVLARLRINIPSLHQLVGGLSGGQRQALAIAKAIRHRVKVLILDEPTHNLDKNAIETFTKVIKERLSKLLTQTFIVTHEEKLAESADNLIKIK